ncbi:MAG: radical SAM protein [Desulfomonilaceae bacterium]
MKRNEFHHVYGPVFSKRLGRSLGVDLTPSKTCSYNCIYCQLGRTSNNTIERKDYIQLDSVMGELETKLNSGPFPDYISLAGSGEPTLHNGIGSLIRKIKLLSQIPVAIFTNGSLLWIPETREDLMDADLVLPSLDAGDNTLFQYVNRPHPGISFDKMVQGIVQFKEEFSGAVWLEVFLLGGVTGTPSEVKKIASLIEHINPDRVQLNTVSRPPAEEFAFAVNSKKMQEFKKLIPGTVELIIEKNPLRVSTQPQPAADNLAILALLSRRPCTVQGVSSGLGLNPSEVAKQLQHLSRHGEIRAVRRNDEVFYEKVGLQPYI